MFCPEVQSPQNGRVRYENLPSALRPGLMLQYTCNTGYTLEGAMMAVCQLNGTWSAPVPTCLLGWLLGWLTCMALDWLGDDRGWVYRIALSPGLLEWPGVQ